LTVLLEFEEEGFDVFFVFVIVLPGVSIISLAVRTSELTA
jgi:hypothetical protein